MAHPAHHGLLCLVAVLQDLNYGILHHVPAENLEMGMLGISCMPISVTLKKREGREFCITAHLYVVTILRTGGQTDKSTGKALPAGHPSLSPWMWVASPFPFIPFCLSPPSTLAWLLLSSLNYLFQIIIPSLRTASISVYPLAENIPAFWERGPRPPFKWEAEFPVVFLICLLSPIEKQWIPHEGQGDMIP